MSSELIDVGVLGDFKSYEELLEQLYLFGVRGHNERTGERVVRAFGAVIRHLPDKGFPLLTTKRVFFRGVAEELAWFLRGSNCVRELQDRKVRIWDEHILEDGTIGPGYGPMWRAWPRVDGSALDQITRLVEGIRKDPSSRRHVVVAYNPGEADRCSLPPCHVMFQVVVIEQTLHLLWTQRSCDVFLGLPFNLASYALLQHLLAAMTGLKVGVLQGTLADAHLYIDQHEAQVIEQLARPRDRKMPELWVHDRVRHPDFDLATLRPHDVEPVGYDPYEAIKGKIVK
jgi:thymidylate synthase